MNVFDVTPTVSVLARRTGENNYFAKMCSGSEKGSYLRLRDFVHHSTLGLRVIKKRRRCSPPLVD